MTVSFNKRDPIYLQVVQDFKQKIASGELEPGQEDPSRRELASKLKINPNTVQRAYKEMEDQHLLYTEGNSPSRITENQSVLIAVRKTLIQKTVDDFISNIESAKLPPEEVTGMIREKLNVKES